MILRSIGAAALVALAGAAALAQGGATPVYPEGSKPIAPYSPGMAVGDLVFVSGQIPYVEGAIPAAATDGTDDIQDQTKIVMDNLSAVLAEAGLTLEHAVKVEVFLSDIGHYGGFNEVYGPYWTDNGWTPPARAAVEVGALPGGKPGAPVLVEVSLIAARPAE